MTDTPDRPAPLVVDSSALLAEALTRLDNADRAAEAIATGAYIRVGEMNVAGAALVEFARHTRDTARTYAVMAHAANLSALVEMMAFPQRWIANAAPDGVDCTMLDAEPER